MQTLPRTSLKNNYPCQILIILASMLTWTYNFVIKRILRGCSIASGKKSKILCFCFYTKYWTSTFYSPSNNSNNQPKNTFLNDSAKDRYARGISCHLVLNGNCPTCKWLVNCPTVNVLLIVRSSCFEKDEILWWRGRSFVRRIWTWNLCR